MSLPGPAEAARGFLGAVRLARFDPAARGWFDLSVAGFWRSFGAMAYVAPLYLLLVHLPGLRPGLQAADPFFGYPIEVLNYVLRWLAYPFALYWLARPLGLTGAYIPFIIAYNWSQLVQVAVLILPAAILAQILLPGAGGRALMSLVVVAVFAYQLAIARQMLGVGWFFAFGMVCLDWVLGLSVDRVTDWLLYQLSSTAPPAGLDA